MILDFGYKHVRDINFNLPPYYISTISYNKSFLMYREDGGVVKTLSIFPDIPSIHKLTSK